MKVAGIIRKSPTKSKEEDKAIKKHRELILKRVQLDYKKTPKIEWFVDICSGDDEQGRKKLFKFFNKISEFDKAYCFDVDRFSRSWLGLKWFHQYFMNSNCKLIFLDGTKLYNEDRTINEEGYMFFFIKCAFAEYELMKIRNRTKLGRERIKADPKLRKLKYKGGKKGRTWNRKK